MPAVTQRSCSHSAAWHACGCWVSVARKRQHGFRRPQAKPSSSASTATGSWPGARTPTVSTMRPSPPSPSDGDRDLELAQLRDQLAAATAAACDAYEDNARLVQILTVLGQPYSPEEMSVEALITLSQTFHADVTC